MKLIERLLYGTCGAGAAYSLTMAAMDVHFTSPATWPAMFICGMAVAFAVAALVADIEASRK